MSARELEIEEISRHRNGISGVGFYIVKFKERQETADPTSDGYGWAEMLAVVFDLETDENGRDDFERGEFYNCPTAVFDRGLLAEGEIRFFHNSFRGDHYDHWLRSEIAAWDASDAKEFA
jgi:hypothetical protein